MIRKKQIIFQCMIALAIQSVISQASLAQDFGNSQVISTAVPSLRIPVDARGGGMGETGIAVSADANSMFRNIAKTPFATNQSALAVNYTPWMRDVTRGMYLMSLSGYHRPDTLQAITASIRYFNLGDFALQDYNGNLLQTTRPNDLLVDLGYARRLSDHIGIGVALRYISSNLANGNIESVKYKPGESLAGDLSFFYNGLNSAGEGFSAGLSISNLGARISYTSGATKEFIPANLGIGAAYTLSPEEGHRITLAADINKLLVPEVPVDADKRQDYYNMGLVKSYTKSLSNNALQYSLGAEYNYYNYFSLRAGYFMENQHQGDRKGFTAGAGMAFKAWRFDLSYIVPSGNGITRNPLSNTFRVGLQFMINQQTD